MATKTIGQRLDQVLSNGRLRTVLVGVALLGLGILMGTLVPPPHAARGEVTPAAPPPPFKSGDQLSVPILRDIAGTLHQIDGRLSRLEKVFNELTAPVPRGPAGN